MNRLLQLVMAATLVFVVGCKSSDDEGPTKPVDPEAAARGPKVAGEDMAPSAGAAPGGGGSTGSVAPNATPNAPASGGPL